MPAQYQATPTFKATKQQLFISSTRVLGDCKFRPVVEDMAEGLIEAKVLPGLLSWGEKITIQVEEGAITVKSECVYPLQLIDWGKNKKNVKRFFEKISEVHPI